MNIRRMQVLKSAIAATFLVLSVSIFGQTISSLTLKPTSVIGGGSAKGTVKLSSPAPPSGVTIKLSTKDSGTVSIPASIKISSGSTQGTFAISTKACTTTLSPAMKAQYGTSSKTATFEVLGDTIASLALSPASVAGGSESEATVTLKEAAPAGGWKVSLSSQNTSNVSLPSSVTIPAGMNSKAFKIKTTAYYETFSSAITASDILSSHKKTLTVTSATSFVIVNMGGTSVAYDAVHDLVLFTPLSQDGTLKVVDPKTGKILKSVPLPAAANIVTMTGDGKRIVVGLTDNIVRILNSETYAIDETIDVPGNQQTVEIIPLPGTSDSLTICSDPWTYVFDGPKQRPNDAALGIIQAIGEDGIHFVGSDYRYSPNAYIVAKIDANGFKDVVSGYGPVSPDLTDQFGYPVDGSGIMLDPNTAQKIAVLPFVSSSNRRVSAIPHTNDIVALCWSPNYAQILDVATRASLGGFLLPPTDGGLGFVTYAGDHRIAYYNFGAISDPVVVIVKNPLVP